MHPTTHENNVAYIKMWWFMPVPLLVVFSLTCRIYSFFLAFSNSRESAKVECLQIKWKNLRNTHLLLKHSCVGGNEDLHASVLNRNDWAEDNIPT